ncbi:rod shape-determining protein MreD [Candidatus Pelagibacter sp.]|nr:rod shape-determining protein MreD [Candidatus Pelagibacter sp.]|tara:strand:+ start:2017 stop:2517 length:501 start_codon:yes stop_codon:yes gene_type:complete
MVKKKINLKNKFLKYFPLILLYFSVLNEFDIDVSNNWLISFNLPFIIIFYWSLKDPDQIGNGLIFISGILNDVTLGYPIGISSFIYLTIIAFAAYLRNITLRPNIYKDSVVFLVAILFANSVNALILGFIFSIEINFFEIITNITFTYVLYFLFAKIFNYLKPVGA